MELIEMIIGFMLTIYASDLLRGVLSGSFGLSRLWHKLLVVSYAPPYVSALCKL